MIPSRYQNPFATCWTKPGALPYRFPSGEFAQQYVVRLESHNWRGQILGKHGAGKSTLLEQLIPALKRANRVIRHLVLRDGQRHLSHAFLRSIAAKKGLVIVDGYEQLSWWHRWCLNQRLQQTGAGLLATCHQAINLPVLAKLEPSLRTVQAIAQELALEIPTDITPDQVSASFEAHNGNVREILFDLYDLHEEQSNKRRSNCE